MTLNLDMGNTRIINAVHPRNPQDSVDYDPDLVTDKFLHDYIEIADCQFLKANEADRPFFESKRRQYIGRQIRHETAQIYMIC